MAALGTRAAAGRKVTFDRRIASLLTGTAAASLANSVAGLIATRLLPPSERGLMVLALTVGTLVPILASLGTGTALRALLNSSEVDRRAVEGAYGAVTTLLLPATLILAPVVGLATLGRGTASPPLLCAIGLSALAQLGLRQLMDLAYARGDFHSPPRWSAAAAALGLCLVLVVPLIHPTATAVVIAQAAGSLVIAFPPLARELRSSHRRSSGWNLGAGRALLRLGIGALPWTLGIVFVLRVDRIILGQTSGMEAVAVYGLAATVSEVPRLAATAISQLAAHASSIQGGARGLIRLYIQATALVVVAGALVWVGALWATVPLFGRAYAQAPSLVSLLVVGEVGYGLFLMSSMALMGRGRVAWPSTLCCAASLVSIPLYYFLTASSGPAGAATGSVILYWSMGAISTLVLWVHLKRGD